jgi:hypothetical protein
MGCNCGGRKTREPAPPVDEKEQEASAGLTQSFTLQVPSGQRFVFGSRLEADAMRVRAGGQGTISATR